MKIFFFFSLDPTLSSIFFEIFGSEFFGPEKMHFLLSLSVCLFFDGSTFGSSLATQKPSFEINTHLYNVIFHFDSKLRLVPRSGVRKIDFSTPKWHLNIFLRIGGCSPELSMYSKIIYSKTWFSWFLDTLTLFGRFEDKVGSKEKKKNIFKKNFFLL